MKKTRIANFGFIISCVLLIGAQFVSTAFSADTFQNNLLKADVYKSPIGGIKVTLFTSKPYGDAVMVNKKSDLEYVILMPETSNSMTAKPSLKFVTDVVKSVEIKTQPYANQVKGYTKIVISTTKPIEITSQVQTLKAIDYKVAENDYKELLEQTVKKKTNLVKKEIKEILPAKKEAAKPIATRTAAKAKMPVKPAEPKVVQKVVQKVANKVAPAVVVKKAEPKVAPKATLVNTKVAPKAVQNKVETKAPAETVVAEKSAVEEVTPPVIEKVASPVVTKKEVEVNNAFTLKNIKRIVKNNLYTLLGVLAALFILLLLIAKKINKNTDKQKEIFANHLDEKPETITNYEENITEDMNWKEKFQTYVETTQAQQEQDKTEPEEVQTNPELDDLFSGEAQPEGPLGQTADELFSEDFAQEVIEEPAEETPEEDDFDRLISEEEFGYQTASLDELFGDEETETAQDEESLDLVEEELQAEPEDEFIRAEFAIDDEKGFYLVDFEDATALVGHIGEEIFVLKRFEQKVYGPIHARLNEKNGYSATYMTKVGDFRAMVDVTPGNMNLLIEL